MTGPRILSLCSGVGALDLGVMDAIGGEVIGHAQYDPDDELQWAAQILEHHWPGIPNYGDITTADWTSLIGHVDVVTAGFPCQDLSLAGLKAGLMPGTRSGIWSHVMRAIAALRPRLVVIENVRSLLSARAHSDMELCPWCLGDEPDQLALRALGAVLGDLADGGFDAEWRCVPASDVGAPHLRWRVFIVAWPSVAFGVGSMRPDAEGDRPHPRMAPDGTHGGPNQRGSSGDLTLPSAAVQLLPTPRASANENRGITRTPSQEAGKHGLNLSTEACLIERERERGRLRDQAAADTDSVGRERGGPARGRRDGPAHHDQNPDVDWGPYTAAVRRWEVVTRRAAPAPTEPGKNGPRLSPALPEWMLGLPEGWITQVPGVPRNAQLKAAGNSVVVLQCTEALRLLRALDRYIATATAVLG